MMVIHGFIFYVYFEKSDAFFKNQEITLFFQASLHFHFL